MDCSLQSLTANMMVSALQWFQKDFWIYGCGRRSGSSKGEIVVVDYAKISPSKIITLYPLENILFDQL
ncbi:hypothetical protein D5R40_25385 [Okeania hirsuta]|uniref:Uncharacterized protein n=1 Tax=Okeania hirsuta TaxID=1458930 RepID=A0A3N6P530_9CYAN|nr:hypothetical protein D5R40_25385 [Okeania hirsuta]